jgi:hypothetical protein
MQMSYHNLFVTTDKMERTQFSKMEYGFDVVCNRATGWTLVNEKGRQVAGEFDRPGHGLRLDIDGVVFVDGMRKTA